MAKILVIDDDDIIRALIRKMLERAGHAVVDTANGRQALEMYRQEAVELIITDLFMPDKEGMEVIRELREENAAAKIIAISGGSSLDSMDYLEIARLIGASKTLTKPFGWKQLLTTVDEVLDVRD